MNTRLRGNWGNRQMPSVFLCSGKRRHRGDHRKCCNFRRRFEGAGSVRQENRIDLTVVGPDDPLAAGIVDLFAAEKLRAFGPTKLAARIEASKIFAKELMRAQKIPTAEARTFTHSKDALDYCQRLEFPVVIKADGLALGKE